MGPLLTSTDVNPSGRRRGRDRDSVQPYMETTMSGFAAKSSRHDRWTSLLACLTCVAYGGIHAAGWNFVFATQVEQLLWRISCPLLIILGALMYSFISALERNSKDNGLLSKLKSTWTLMTVNFRYWDGDTRSAIFHSIALLCFFPYCAARMFVVVEAFISLRHVPEPWVYTKSSSGRTTHLISRYE